jgi:hypothetical protein
MSEIQAHELREHLKFEADLISSDIERAYMEIRAFEGLPEHQQQPEIERDLRDEIKSNERASTRVWTLIRAIDEYLKF